MQIEEKLKLINKVIRRTKIDYHEVINLDETFISLEKYLNG